MRNVLPERLSAAFAAATVDGSFKRTGRSPHGPKYKSSRFAGVRVIIIIIIIKRICRPIVGEEERPRHASTKAPA